MEIGLEQIGMEMWIEMQNRRLEIGMEMERNDRDLKVKKCYICNFRGSEFLIWVNFSFLENSEPLESVFYTVKMDFPNQNKKSSKTTDKPSPFISILSPSTFCIPISIPITNL